MNCPKCNFDNAEDAVFCENCGAKLIEEKLVCPKCGTENNPSAKFCKKCGNALKETEVVKKETQPVKQVSNRARVSVLKIVAASIIGLALGFILIGMFTGYLTVIVRNGSNVNTSSVNMVKYIFNDMFKELERFRDLDNGSSYYTINIILRILVLISYVVMVIGVIAFTTVTIINVAKNVTKKDFSLKSSIGLVASILPFILITSWVFIGEGEYPSLNIRESLRFGSGTVLLVISVFLIVIAIILDRIDNAIKEKNIYSIISTGLLAVSSIFFIIMGMLICGTVLSCKNSSTYTECSASYRLVAEYLNTDLGGDPSKGVEAVVIGFFLGIFSYIFIVSSIPTFIHKPSAGTCAFVGFATILMIISICITVGAGKLETTSFAVSPTFIFAIVIALNAFGAAIAGLIIGKKKTNQVALS